MAFAKASVRDAEVEGRRALVRVDFNVPLADGPDGSRVVADDMRIRAALPTLELLRERGASLVLASHLGRPKGKVDPSLSLKPVGERLSELLGVPVAQAPEVVGAEAEALAAALGPGEVLLLENTRFEPGETENDTKLAEGLAALGDVFVNDAFGAAHRAHASTEGVAQFLPGYAGLLLEREVTELTRVVEAPARPLVVVLGGAKVSDKVLIRGAMAFSFFRAEGVPTGDSLVEEEGVELAAKAVEKARDSECELVLPVDLVLGREFSADTERRESHGIEVPDGWMGLDVGPLTGKLYGDAVMAAGTVLWNGPMGAFELEPFATGTKTVAEAVAAAPGTTVIGGGDSVAAIRKFGLEDEVDWLSTGGGASLELLEGKKLPGVEALVDA